MSDAAELALVTGATGMVGAALVRQLVDSGRRVRILTRVPARLELLDGARVEMRTGDVTDAESVRAAVEGTTHVWHAAGLIELGGRRAERRLFEVNEGGTANVVDAALEEGVQRLVHVSSIAAIGRGVPTGDVIDEDTPWTTSAANSAYARSKRAAELQVQRGIAEGLDAVIVNPALIFGRGRPGEGTMRIVERVAAGQARVAPPGATCFVDVEDVAAGMRAAMERGRPGERYLLGGENLAWTDALGILARAFNRPSPRYVIPAGLLRAAAGAAEAVAALTRTSPSLTREQAHSASSTYRYSSRKALDELGVSFRPFAETAARLARAQQ
jgi:dihydroflavonol-4-reductase